MHVGEGELERLVDQDAGHIGKHHQAVVGEDGAQPHGARVQQRLVCLRWSQCLSWEALDTPVVWGAQAQKQSSADAQQRISLSSIRATWSVAMYTIVILAQIK